MPERIQLRRTKGWRKPEGAISVARPTKWGNPFKVGGERPPWQHRFGQGAIADTTEAVEHFRLYTLIHFVPVDPTSGPHRGIYAAGVESLRAHAVRHLRGHDLACWCAPGAPCHADVLLELANAGAEAGSPSAMSAVKRCMYCKREKPKDGYRLCRDCAKKNVLVDPLAGSPQPTERTPR